MFKRLGVFRTRLLIELLSLALRSIPLFEKEGRGEIFRNGLKQIPLNPLFEKGGCESARAGQEECALDKSGLPRD